jgi:hypothetical protein
MKISLAQAGGITSDLTSGALTWTDLPVGDVQSVSITRGLSTEFDSVASGKCTLVLDNFSAAYDPDNSSGTYYPNLEIGRPMQVAGVFSAVTYPRFRGYIDDIVPSSGYDPTTTITLVDGVDLLSRAQVPARTVRDFFGELVDDPAYDGDTTGTRIGRILDLAGRPATMRALDTGASKCSATVFGNFALSLIQEAVETELGWFFQDVTGMLQFKDRYAILHDAVSTGVQATITDVGTDVDMLSVARRRGANTVFNDATITRSQAPAPPAVPNLRLFPRGPLRFTQAREAAEKPASQNYQDATSVSSYGIRSYPGSPGKLLRADQYAWAMASWLVSRYKNPANIVSSVEVDAAQNGTALWSTLLALDLLYRIRLKRTHGVPATFAVDKQLLILGISEDITPDSWHFTFNTVDPARLVEYSFVLDNGSTGKLNTSQLGF